MSNLGKIFCVLLLITGTTNAQSKAEKRSLKEEKANLEYNSIKELVETGNFVFEAGRTIPLGGQSISLTTNANQLKIQDGEADIFLPYFGVGRGGGGYNHEPGIKYKGMVRHYKTAFKDENRKIIIKFDIKNGSETQNFVCTVGRRGNTSVLVRSSGRSTITYGGYLRPADQVLK